jgi:hypothetical protein
MKTAAGLVAGMLSATALLAGPLLPEERAAFTQTALADGSWQARANELAAPLLANPVAEIDAEGGKDRLHLSQIFFQLGLRESMAGAPFFSRYFEEKIPLEHIAKMLESEKKSEGTAKLLASPLHLPRSGTLAQRIKPETLTALLQNGPLVNLLGQTLSENDYLPGVWQILADLQEHHPTGVAEYPGLAVALAVVYDQALPPWWPHHQMAQAEVPKEPGNWSALFDFFITSDQNGKLLMRLEKLEPDQLKYLVDAPLKIDEFLWAQKNIRKNRSSFDAVFDMVDYDMPRMLAKKFAWPYGDYSLAHIQKRKGICVDQAYFAWISGKANGLPTLFFSGQGRDGGHAWFGYLKSDDAWDMEAGRYRSQNYVTGEARDPQTWNVINDHQLAFITSRATSTAAYKKSNDLVILASLPSEGMTVDKRVAILRAARETCPANVAAWTSLAVILDADKAAAKTFYEEMAQQFSKQPDIAILAKRNLAALAAETGDTATAAALQKEMMKDNRSKRSDLGIGAASEILANRLEEKNYEAALIEYKAVLRRFRQEGGGNLFYDVIRPFVQTLHDAGEDEKSEKALDYAHDKLQPARDSILAMEFEELRSLVVPRKNTRRP